MHYQLFQSAALLAALLPGALAAVAASSLERPATWETTTEAIQLSRLGTIIKGSQNPNPGHVALRNLEARGMETALVCRGREPPLNSGGKWLYNDASCDRTGTNVRTFKVSCSAINQPADLIYRVPGTCGEHQTCFDFHGWNELGQSAWDVDCVDKSTIHTWVANTFRDPNDITTCSSEWNNDSKRAMKVTFEVDVMDSGAVNRIAPSEIFYQLNKKRIGVSRRKDPAVGSGKVIIPPGGSIQACVTAFGGQILNMMGGVTSLIYV